MKKLLILALLFVGCDDLLTDSDESSQFIYIYLSNSDEYYDDEDKEWVDGENTSASGWIDSDPYCEFNYLKLDTLSFIGDEYTELLLGYKYFPTNNKSMRIMSNFNSIDVELKTSLGKVEKRIALPDTIMTLGLSATSNLPLSSPFTISWAGSNADFYSVSLDYSYKDENDNWEYEYLTEYTSDNNYTFSGSIFSYNGDIDYIRVQPINGTMPEVGGKGNMSGDGSGFLYYGSKSTSYDGDEIIVGSGSNGRISRNQTNIPIRQKINNQIRDDIKNRILDVSN